jgi:hypothetical protein
MGDWDPCQGHLVLSGFPGRRCNSARVICVRSKRAWMTFVRKRLREGRKRDRQSLINGYCTRQRTTPRGMASRQVILQCHGLEPSRLWLDTPDEQDTLREPPSSSIDCASGLFGESTSGLACAPKMSLSACGFRAANSSTPRGRPRDDGEAIQPFGWSSAPRLRVSHCRCWTFFFFMSHRESFSHMALSC